MLEHGAELAEAAAPIGGSGVGSRFDDRLLEQRPSAFALDGGGGGGGGGDGDSIAGAIAGVAEAAALAVVLETELGWAKSSQKSHALHLQYSQSCARVRYRQKTGVHRWRGMSSASDVRQRGADGGSGEGGGGCGEGGGGEGEGEGGGGGDGGDGDGDGPGGGLGGGGGGGEGGDGWGGGGDFWQNLHVRHLHFEQWNFLYVTSHHESHVGCSHL